MHDIDLKVAIAVRLKGDLRAIWRPIGLSILGIVVGQPSLPIAIDIHNVNFEIAITVSDYGSTSHTTTVPPGLVASYTPFPAASRVPSGDQATLQIGRE